MVLNFIDSVFTVILCLEFLRYLNNLNVLAHCVYTYCQKLKNDQTLL